MDAIQDAVILSTNNAIFGGNGISDETTFIESASAPDIEKAKAHRASLMINFKEEGQSKRPSVLKTKIKDLGAYGIGLELYFLMLKQVGFAFLLISLVSIWPIVENFYGGGLTDGEKKQPWDSLTLANQYQYSLTMTLNEANSQFYSYKNSKIRLVIADLIYTLIFVFFIVYFSMTTEEKIESNLRKNITADNYAVEVDGIPEDAVIEKEFFDHFSQFGEVVEVYLARKYDGILGSYHERANLALEALYYERVLNTDAKASGKLQKIKKKIKKFDLKIEKKERTSSLTHDELPVIRAFVIFNDLKDRERCLKAYSQSHSCCRKFKSELKLRNMHKMKVSPTSEPSNINWENLEYSPCKRLISQVIVVLIACILIVISITIIYLLRSFDDGQPSSAECLAKYGVSSSTSFEQAQKDYTTNTEKYCYCSYVSIQSILSSSSLRNFCSYYLEQRSYSITIRFLASAAVIMLNFFLKKIFRILSKFEKAQSRSEEQVKVMRKVFVMMFINTSLVVLLVNADFSSLGFIQYLPFKKYIFTGAFSDFTRNWYVQAGSTVTITLLISVFSPHLLNILMFYPIGVCKRSCTKKCKTQRDLNIAFTGPEFDIATRYSQVLNVIFSSLLYSAGIPLLNITCCCTFFVLYWTDKFLILRHYSKPPRYSASLNKDFISLLPYAAIFHCGFSLWMLGSDSIFPQWFYIQNGYLYAYSNTIYDRILSISGIINISVIFIGIIVYMYATKRFIFLFSEENIKAKVETEKAEKDPMKFNKVLNIIKDHGLHSYNILLNPAYGELILSLNAAAEAVKGFKKVNQSRSHNESQDFLIDNL